VETDTVDFLRKPFTPQVLVHAIRRTLARSNGRRSMQWIPPCRISAATVHPGSHSLHITRGNTGRAWWI